MKFKLILILFFSMLFCCVNAQNSEKENEKPRKFQQWQGDPFRGISLHADIGSPVIGVLGGKIGTYELQLDFNIYRRLFPIFELGFASADQESEIGVRYRTRAPFFRLGVNYGLLRPFTDKGKVRSLKCYPFIGIRYAFSPMNYNITNVDITDDYWGSASSESFKEDMLYSGWLEVLAGVRVDLYKGLTMGWSVRLKTLLHTTAPDKSYVWYVPGYGKSGDVGVMFNYTIGYTFYWGKDKK